MMIIFCLLCRDWGVEESVRILKLEVKWMWKVWMCWVFDGLVGLVLLNRNLFLDKVVIV